MKTVYKTFVVSVAASAALVLSGCGGGGDSDGTTEETTLAAFFDAPGAVSVPYPAPALPEEVKQAFVQAVNEARASDHVCGEYGLMPAVPPLAWNDAIYRAAQEHSDDMAAVGYVGHTGSGTASDWTAMQWGLERGSLSSERVSNSLGYPVAAFENAAGLGTQRTQLNYQSALQGARYTVNEWLNSPGHCKAIMSPDAVEFGMAFSKGVGYEYWTYNALSFYYVKDQISSTTR